jgi:Spy/CpxP family protein refolding chaperone
MRTSRKAIMLLMVGAMLIAATAGAFAQGFGHMKGPGTRMPGYGFFYGYQFQAPDSAPENPPTAPRIETAKLDFIGLLRLIVGNNSYATFYAALYQRLPAEQKAQVEQIVKEAVVQILPLQNGVRGEKLLLDNLLWASDTDKAKIDESIGKISDLQKQIEEARVNCILELNKIFQAALQQPAAPQPEK